MQNYILHVQFLNGNMMYLVTLASIVQKQYIDILYVYIISLLKGKCVLSIQALI